MLSVKYMTFKQLRFLLWVIYFIWSFLFDFPSFIFFVTFFPLIKPYFLALSFQKLILLWNWNYFFTFSFNISLTPSEYDFLELGNHISRIISWYLKSRSYFSELLAFPSLINDDFVSSFSGKIELISSLRISNYILIEC